MNENEFRELSAGRALGALSPADERAFAEALAAHPEWNTFADHDAETSAMLGEAVTEVTPPSGLRSSLLDSITKIPQQSPKASTLTAPEAPEESEETPSRASSMRRVGFFALAASVIVLLAVTFTPRIWQAFTPQDPVSIALERIESATDAHSETAAVDGAGSATLHWSESEAQAVLVAQDLPKIPDDRDFELWLVRGETPISLGVIQANDDRSDTVIADGFEPGDVVALTIEANGGSASGAPTTEPIFAVSTA